MSRLIDADLLKECYAGTNALDGKADYMSIRKMIDNQPTAYDIEKVVEKTRKKLDKLLHICSLEDVEKVYDFYDSLEESIRKGGTE